MVIKPQNPALSGENWNKEIYYQFPNRYNPVQSPSLSSFVADHIFSQDDVSQVHERPEHFRQYLEREAWARDAEGHTHSTSKNKETEEGRLRNTLQSSQNKGIHPLPSVIGTAAR